MNNTEKKNRSILFHLFIPFMCVVIIGMIVWAILAISMGHTNILNQTKETASEASTLVSDMYENNPVLKNLVDGKNVDDTAFDTTQTKLRFICQAFDMQYLYLFRADAANDTRIFYISVASEDMEHEMITRLSKGYIRNSTAITQQEKEATNGIKPDEPDVYTNEYGDEYAWYFPIIGQNGSTEVLVGMDFRASFMEKQFLRTTLALLNPIVVQLLLILFILIFFVKRIVTKPLSIVSLNMKNFVENYEQDTPALTDQFRSHGEIRDISQAYDKMKSDIIHYLSDIRSLTAEKTKQQALDKLTTQIQKGIVPPELNQSNEGFEACAITEAAKNVGGDFYDCFIRDDGSVCAVIGDVSGKGISAALFMAMSKAMIREHLKMGESPAHVLNYVNDEICESNPEGMFATVFALVMNPKTGEMTFSNAGHIPPVLWEPGAKPIFLKPDSGLAIGLFSDAGMIDETITLRKSQGLFLYTDGITEAVDSNNRFFGEERLLSAIEEALQSTCSPSEITNYVISSVRQHEEGCLPFDDITALALSH